MLKDTLSIKRGEAKSKHTSLSMGLKTNGFYKTEGQKRWPGQTRSFDSENEDQD